MSLLAIHVLLKFLLLFKKKINDNLDTFFLVLQNLDLWDMQSRNIFTQHIAWAIPSKTAIKDIVSFIKEGTSLEVGSGLGLWGMLLRAYGSKIILTDNYCWTHVTEDRSVTSIEKIDALDAINKYQTDTLILIWPPIGNMAYDCLKLFKGKRVVYVGEEKDGCNANYAFFDILENDYELKDILEIPRWSGINDSVFLYIKKSKGWSLYYNRLINLLNSLKMYFKSFF